MDTAKAIIGLMQQGKHNEANGIARQMLREAVQQAQAKANEYGDSVFVVPADQGFSIVEALLIRPEIYLECIPQGEKPIAHQYNYTTGCWS